MSDSIFAILVTLGIFVLLALWVPCLHLCRRCVRKISRRHLPMFAVVATILAAQGVACGQLVVVSGIKTAAGNGYGAGTNGGGYAGDGGSATAAELALPAGVARDAAGNLYIADTGNNVVRKVSPAGIISTIAGTGAGGFAGDGGPATSAMLNGPFALALDAVGDLYVATFKDYRVRKINAANGSISTVAGNGKEGYTGDGGQAISAEIDNPFDIKLDASGNLYIASGNVVRRVDAVTGIITSIAGTGTSGYMGDGGPATAAGLETVDGIAFDAAGNLYLADATLDTVRKVTTATGIITTVIGTAFKIGSSGDGGPAAAALLSEPYGVAFDAAGNLYIGDTGNNKIREVSAAGIINTLAGNGTNGYTDAGGAATNAEFRNIHGIVASPGGQVYVADYNNNRIRAVGPLVIPATAVGSSSAAQNLLLQTTAAETISNPFVVPASLGGKQEYSVGTVTGCATDGITSNPVGTICTVPLTFSPAYPGQRPVPLQVATSAGNVAIGLDALGQGPLASLTPGILSTVAGNGLRGFTGNGGPATSAEIDVTQAPLTVDSSGNLYFADNNNVVRKITASTGVITQIAGGGPYTYSGDGGPATSASLNGVFQVALDPAGNLFIADAGNNVIRRVDAVTGIITTFAGTGTQGSTGDGGPATNAQLYLPFGVAFDNEGNLYIATQHVVRKVAVGSGIITTVAGTGSLGNTGDGGQATSAMLNAPTGLAVDSADNLYIADQLAAVVRKVSLSTGVISTVAGNGTHGNSGDGGLATSAQLYEPVQAAVDSAGDVYIVDDRNLTVRRVEAVTGVISTIAGYGQSFSGIPSKQDGLPATTAYLNTPYGVAVDGAGSVYINAAIYIRKVDVSTSALLYATTTPVGSSDTVDDPQSFTVSNIGNTNLTIPTNGAVTDPVVSAAWSVEPSSTCLNLSGSEYNLIPGKDCVFAVDFTPAVPGANNGTLVLGDNSLNNVAATQTVTLAGQGTPLTTVATITLSPTSITFPDTQSGGASASQTITVSNTGTATANITGITITGDNRFSFFQSNNCLMTLASGSSCTITVTFTPQSATSGIRANISVASNDPNSPATTSLIGNGTPAGSLTISPTTQVFPVTKVGQVSTALTSTISNTTAQAIYLSSGSLTDGTDFTQSDNCNGLVGAGKTCSVSFVFSPQSSSVPLASTYAIHDLNNPNSPLTVSLSGLGLSAGVGAITLTPSAVTFTTTAGVTAPAQSVTLTNTGTAQVTLGTAPITIGGTNATVFQGSAGFCGYALAVGASCNASVTFTSTTVGTYTATFIATYFTSGTTTATASVPLTGTVTGTAGATLSPSALSFTTVTGTTPATQTATLTNNGTAALTVSSVALSGSNATSFSIANGCGTTLAAGASCAVTIGFTATTVGSYSATLTVTDSASPTTQTVALSGTVTGTAQAVLSPSALSFTTVAGTTPATQTATLTNNGTAALTISSVALSGSNAASFSVANGCGTTLAAGASCAVTIGFTATTVGSYSATLTATDSASPTTQTVALSGTVTGVAQASLLPGTLTFTTVSGTASAAQTATLSNAGSAPLAITSIGLTGANAGLFHLATNTCGATLAAGASCTFGVTFSPAAVGSFTAALSVVDSVGTQNAALNGTATAPSTPPDFSLTATPASQSSYRGRSVIYTLQLASLVAVNPFGNPVTLSVTGLPAGVTASFSPASVVPGSATATTSLIVTIPALVGASAPPLPPGGRERWPVEGAGLSVACLLGGAMLRRRRRMPGLLAVLLLCGLGGLAASTTGCGSSTTGFGIPTSTSTLLVTGTSGTTAHSTTVTLTIQ